jgi:hypothetical protein
MTWTREEGGHVLTAGTYVCRVWQDADGFWRGFITDGQWATTQISFRSEEAARAWAEERLTGLLGQQSRERGG